MKVAWRILIPFPPRRHARLQILLGSLLLSTGCLTDKNQAGTKHPDWMEWRAKRHESIAGTNGWITIVARQWLNEGPSKAGSDPTNQVVLPGDRAAPFVGTFVRTGRHVRFEAAADVRATLDGQMTQVAHLVSDASNAPTRLHIGSLSFVVIERGDRLGVRVRDSEARARKEFRGLTYFPYADHWRIEGSFETFPAIQTLRVGDVTGGTQDLLSPGMLVFKYRGEEYRLQTAIEPGEEDLFVIFRDQTAGDSTYGSGRFLYVPRPAPNQRVVIDFNRAYTPPCGFTPFATCPLPPRQNWLPFAVKAGERKPIH